MTARVPQPFARPRPLISVWPTGQLDSPAQLADGHYVPETAQDVGRMPPAVAAHAIATYTRPGDTVLDPNCGAGTVPAEALRSGRHAIGLTSQPRWWPVARANITAAKYDGATPDGMVLDHPPALAATRLAGLSGDITLILTALRPTASAHQPDRPGDGEGAPHAPATRLCRTLTECRLLLCPGGHVIVTVQPRRRRGYLLDLTGPVLEAGEAAGLIPVDRCIALLAELRGDRLITRNSPTQRRSAGRHQRTTGHPTALTVHHDAVVFRAPVETAQVTARSVPIPLAGSASRQLIRHHLLEDLGMDHGHQVAIQRSAA
ncbi:DNA methyltransferase [Streptomyces aurantiacus]|uniref:DNA methyltransferase n=1 Tax=Streptomyces aurantiacus TaxID=47760 RepID=UPI0006E2E16B|nr:DNA methyltransferase [Streptomyces aurantiacus]